MPRGIDASRHQGCREEDRHRLHSSVRAGAVPTARLERWRVETITHPAMLYEIGRAFRPWDECRDVTRETAETTVQTMNERVRLAGPGDQ